MGKYEKKRKTEFEDIESVFARRDRNRFARQEQPRGEPEAPESRGDLRRIRRDAGYSMDNLREVHEGRAVYDDGLDDDVRSSARFDADRERSASGDALFESSAVRGSRAAFDQPDDGFYDEIQAVRDPDESDECGQDGWGRDEYAQSDRGCSAFARQASYPPPRRRKKHRILRILVKCLAALLVLVILGGVLSLLLAKMPETDQPIGPRKDGCCTVLLCGVDENGTRTDTMLLLWLDRNGQQARLLSLPRDTMVNRDNPVPKLNGAYWANGGSKGNPKQGMDMLMDYVKDLVGYRPDGYMLLDLNCFEELVDVMGGVTFDVPMDMEYNDPTQDLYINLKAGTQKLNGKEAMWLVRFRSGYAMADLERVKVQRDFMTAAVRQWKSVTRLPRAPFAASLLLRNTETDLSWRNLCWIAVTLSRCNTGELESDTLPGEPKYINGGAYYVQNRQETAALVNEKYNSYEKEISANDLHPYGY